MGTILWMVSAWLLYWSYIMPYDNHDKHDNEYNQPNIYGS